MTERNNQPRPDVPKQRVRRRVLFAVRDLTRQLKGESPTQAEIAEMVGVRRGSVGKQITKLKEAGWLTSEPGWRTVKLAHPLRRRTPKF